MQSNSDEIDSYQEALKSLENVENKVTNLSQVLTKGSIAAAGINVDTPIVSAIIGNLTGTLPTKKKYGKEIKCKICNCSVSSNIIFQRHVSGAKHQKKLKDLEVFSKLNSGENHKIQRSQNTQSLPFLCEICHLEVNSASQLQNHLSGERHKRKADRLKLFQLDKNEEHKSYNSILGKRISSFLGPEQKVKKNERGLFACHVCNVLLNSKTQQDEHTKSKKHRIKEELREKLKNSKCHENPVSSVIEKQKKIWTEVS